MRAMGKSSDTKSRRVTPPSPSYMSNDQFASYLSELRSNRTSRPGGPRPQPAGPRPAPSRSGTARSSVGRPSLDAPSQTGSLSRPQRPSSQAPSVAAGSVSSRLSMSSARTRDYYPVTPTTPLKASEVVPSATYIERGQRWMEKEEAYSLRDAMEEMDLQKGTNEPTEEEARIYDAALNEAAELVWEHENGPPVSRPKGPYRYRPHLRQNSYAHARTASVGKYGDEIAPSGLARNSGSRSVSSSSSESDGSSRRDRQSVDTNFSREQHRQSSKSYGSIGAHQGSRPTDGRRRSSMKRNISGEVERPFSGDQIWEEPESASPAGAARTGRLPTDTLGDKSSNPVSRVRFESSRDDLNGSKPVNNVEIYRNPPSRSRDAYYRTNAGLPGTPPDDGQVERKNGVEVRGDDIRSATSMRLKDRSPKLPEPTAVSDNPGRPIVSFDANWKAPEESTDVPADQQQATAGPPCSSFQSNVQPPAVVIPSIAVEESCAPRPRSSPREDVPSICLEGSSDATDRPLPSINLPVIAIDDEPTTQGSSGSIPVINVPDDQPTQSSRPLPTPGARGQPARQAQHRPRGHWSPAPGAGTRLKTICHECGLPIEGRFVALAGSPERFHPRCLSCYICGTSLEAMEISPEPTQMRLDRLDRIQRRAAGEILDEEPGATMAEDGDDRMRFYCHLDWHELFAPRCKHCKTPIMGEHVVALGQHWHYGHFFCAECGDPFEQGMTHIEKDGYAWCIKCQTKRTERRAPKCKMCKTAVIGQYIQALGGEWHEHCFRCAECKGGFGDGQIFPKEKNGLMVILCTGCRERDLKQ